jgi:hypothetical protein
MGFVKHGTGEVLPEEEDQTHKTASGPFDDKDKAELAQENEKADR